MASGGRVVFTLYYTSRNFTQAKYRLSTRHLSPQIFALRAMHHNAKYRTGESIITYSAAIYSKPFGNPDGEAETRRELTRVEKKKSVREYACAPPLPRGSKRNNEGNILRTDGALGSTRMVKEQAKPRPRSNDTNLYYLSLHPGSSVRRRE